MIVAGLNWPGWQVLPVLMLSAGFLTLVSLVLPAATGRPATRTPRQPPARTMNGDRP